MILNVKYRLILLGFILLGSALVIMVNYTDACHLTSVELNGKTVENYSDKFGFNSTESILKQPVDSVATRLISKSNIYKVEIARQFPNKINIATNNFEPICYLLDRYEGQIIGVDQYGRMVPLENSRLDWESPVLTSVQAGKMLKRASDYRVVEVVKQLGMLKRDEIDLYRLIEEIDFGNQDFLKVMIAGLDYRIKISSHNFYDEMLGYLEFVSRFKPDLTETKLLDFTFDGMVISSKGKK